MIRTSRPTRRTSEAAAAAASEWFARLQSPQATLEDALAAERWADESPENRRAWAMVQALWDNLGTAGRDPSVQAMRADPDTKPRPVRPDDPPRAARR